jgi:hypothetical protein
MPRLTCLTVLLNLRSLLLSASTINNPLAGPPLELVTEDGLYLITEDGKYVGV